MTTPTSEKQPEKPNFREWTKSPVKGFEQKHKLHPSGRVLLELRKRPSEKK